MYKINKTLLSELFENPNPQPQNKEVFQFYKKLNYRLFPNRKDYICFLQSQTIDGQYEYAEKIIHNLCFYSNFPPSYYALSDVLSLENYQKNITYKTSSYISRDHFLHVVNLYLLGIYIFFYDTEFYSRILRKNKFERQDVKYENTKYDCIKDFISEWKYFCLYHDVGYSAELLGNTEKITDPIKTIQFLQKNNYGFKKSFSKDNIVNQLSFFGTLEIMSKIIMTQLIIENANYEITGSHKMFRTFSSKKLLCYNYKSKKYEPFTFSALSSIIDKSKQLEKVYSNHCLKLLLPVVGPNSIIVVGSLRESSKVIFISYCEGNERKFVIKQGYEKNTEIQKLITYPDFLLFDDYETSEFEFEYLLQEKNSFDEINNFACRDYLENACRSAYKNLGIKFLSISNEYQFLNFQYTIYSWLYTILEPQLCNSELMDFLNSEEYLKTPEEKILFKSKKMKLILDSLNNKYDFNINSICIDFLKEKAITYNHENNPKSWKNANEMITSTINLFFKFITYFTDNKDYKDELQSIADKTYLELLENNVMLLQLFSQIYLKLKCILKKDSTSFTYNYRDNKITNSEFLEKSIKRKLTKRLFGKSLADIQSSYELKYGNTIDHGIASAHYAANIFEIYRNAVDHAKDNLDQKLLSIMLGITGDFENTKYKYIDNYNHVFSETLFAIYVHNLYPDNFCKKSRLREYKTNITDPFSYLALLCDALQQWNRPHNIYPSIFESRPSEDASEDFNILVKDNKIYVYESGTKKSQEQLEKNIHTLTQYLSDINAFLVNGYTS